MVTDMKSVSGRYYMKHLFLVVLALVFFALDDPGAVYAAERAYQHLVIFGDPHLPGKKIKFKEQVVATINGWDDVDMAVAVGDICEELGSDNEYAAAKIFFSKLNKPLYPVVGNHDYIYANELDAKGKKYRATDDIREAKLSRFRNTFGLKDISYSRTAGRYFLVFLSLDSPGHLAEISQKQVDWLALELKRNKKKPTIIFFHAPLDGTVRSSNKKTNSPNFVAQPVGKIRDILISNPQVFLWVSGHTHTSPKEESFASAVNIYEKNVMNIHNTDMERETIWTNSLYLYPDKVVVKTYNHKKGVWLPEFERTVLPPAIF